MILNNSVSVVDRDMAKHGGKVNRVLWAGSDILFDVQICPSDDDFIEIEDGEVQCVKKHVSTIFDCCSCQKKKFLFFCNFRKKNVSYGCK